MDAEREERIARQINRFWIDIIEKGSPREAGRNDLQVRDALDRASGQIDIDIDDAELRKQVHMACADAYHALSLKDSEYEHASKAWALEVQYPSDKITSRLRIQQALARASASLRKFKDALLIADDGLRTAHESLGAHTETIRHLTALAQVVDRMGMPAKGAEILQAALGEIANLHGENSDAAIDPKSMRARMLNQSGRADEGLRILESILRRQREVLGDNHGDTLAIRRNLAMSLHRLGRLDEAAKIYRDVIDVGSRLWGKEHNVTQLYKTGLSRILRHQGLHDEALEMHRDIYEVRARTLKPTDPAFMRTAVEYAVQLGIAGRFYDAEPVVREIVENHGKELGVGHTEMQAAMLTLGRILVDTGRFDEAESFYKDLIESLREALPPGHIELAPALNNYAVVLAKTDRLEEALPYQIECHDIELNENGPANPRTLNAALAVCRTLHKLGRTEELNIWVERLNK
jgi:tetratricopeptide (TPR) repeat protein